MPYLVWSIRVLSLALLFAVLYAESSIQPWIDTTWDYLKTHPAFTSVYFETVYAVITYRLVLFVPDLMDHLSYFERYKVDKRSHFEGWTYTASVIQALMYVAPLAFLDTFMVKKYAGVDPEIIADKRKDWIQHTRALPTSAPTISAILFHIVAAIVIYDFVFFFVHLSLHKNAWLYKSIHAPHHCLKSGVQARLTNQLTVMERLAAILILTGALNLVGGHPLSRALFVNFYVSILMETHSAYDFPFMYDKVIPFGIMGGSKYHYEHHVHGGKNYQPFFTYMDKLYLMWCNWKKIG